MSKGRKADVGYLASKLLRKQDKQELVIEWHVRNTNSCVGYWGKKKDPRVYGQTQHNGVAWIVERQKYAGQSFAYFVAWVKTDYAGASMAHADGECKTMEEAMHEATKAAQVLRLADEEKDEPVPG